MLLWWILFIALWFQIISADGPKEKKQAQLLRNKPRVPNMNDQGSSFGGINNIPSPYGQLDQLSNNNNFGQQQQQSPINGRLQDSMLDQQATKRYPTTNQQQAPPPQQQSLFGQSAFDQSGPQSPYGQQQQPPPIQNPQQNSYQPPSNQPQMQPQHNFLGQPFFDYNNNPQQPNLQSSNPYDNNQAFKYPTSQQNRNIYNANTNNPNDNLPFFSNNNNIGLQRQNFGQQTGGLPKQQLQPNNFGANANNLDYNLDYNLQQDKSQQMMMQNTGQQGNQLQLPSGTNGNQPGTSALKSEIQNNYNLQNGPSMPNNNLFSSAQSLGQSVRQPQQSLSLYDSLSPGGSSNNQQQMGLK